MANQLARWMVGWSIRDCSSAYRLYRVESLKQIGLSNLKESGYGFLEEILAYLIKYGAKVTEVPIVYRERRLGQSKISLQEARSAFSALLKASRIYRSK
jgi:dolichol-phosphate mannosyltransferase